MDESHSRSPVQHTGVARLFREGAGGVLRRVFTYVFCFLMFCAAFLAPGADKQAAAQEPPPVELEDLFVPFGFGLAGSFPLRGDPSFVLGGEVSSVVFASNAVWAGGYLDANYHISSDEVRWSVGPELGWAFFGADAGYAMSIREGELRHGAQFRLLLSAAVVSLYGRATWFAQDNFADALSFEAGLLVKYPFRIKLE